MNLHSQFHRRSQATACFLGCWLLLALGACTTRDEQAYKRARQTDTVIGWEDFLREHPDSAELSKARQRLMELHEDREWQRTELSNSLPAYQRYLRGYPQGRFANEALVRIANLKLEQLPAEEGSPPAETLTAPVAPEATRPPPPMSNRIVRTPAKPVPTQPVPARAKPVLTQPAPAKPAVVRSPRAPSGRWGVQLGVFRHGAAAAESHWQHLRQRAPRALSGLQPVVVPPPPGQVFYRLTVAHLTPEQAKTLCASIRETGEGCLLIAP